MKKISISGFAVFLVLILIIKVSASGFSPSSLTFNLNPNEQSCQNITITSDSELITVSDSWAKDKDVEWKVSLFNENASSKTISVDYPKKLSLDERQVEVCLSGSNPGEYHGVILLREEQQGNSIIQMGVWVKLIINGTPVPETQETPPMPPIPETTEQNQATNTNTGITGNVVAESGWRASNVVWVVLSIVVVVIAAIFIYYKRRKRLKSEGFI